MEERITTAGPAEPVEIDLKDRGIATLLAWLWPGMGHLYQRRYAKGILFMVCILSTFFFGLVLGDGRVVYASWTKNDYRLHYLCQIGVGLPAMPALVQNYLVMRGNEPIRLFRHVFMAPPAQPVRPQDEDELARWHKKLGTRFELGTYYTVIAGLLNVLAIYDAFAGPVVVSGRNEEADGIDP